MTTVGVVGGGAWGTALGIHAARIGHKVLLYAREPDVVEAINTKHENTVFLAGHTCPDNMAATGDLEQVAATCDVVLMVVPCPFVAATLRPVADKFRPDCILVSCTKGILNDTLETPDAILTRTLPEQLHSRLAFLSGPSFAAEVARGLPTVVTIAAKDEAVATQVQHLLSSPKFRCYRSTDVVGVELGGALKNVLAIATGIADGLGMGHNARAALITRGLNEITRLAVACGANPLTMGGLAGVGDLILTCCGDLSRNRSVGLKLGAGQSLADITASMHGAVAEGVLTSSAAWALAQKLGVEVPIIEGTHKIIHNGEDPHAIVDDVMTRDLRHELDPSIAAAAAAHHKP